MTASSPTPPARPRARPVKAAEASLAEAERNLARLLGSAASAADKNQAIPAAQDAIIKAKRAVTAARAARDAIPAKIAVNQAHPGAQRPRTSRAVACLIEELNATPPRIPGDPRPITYCLAAS